MSKCRVQFFTNWCTSQECKEIYEKICETSTMDNYGEDKEIFITANHDYTHVIVINFAYPEDSYDYALTIPKERQIGLSHEPREGLWMEEDFMAYIHGNVNKYFIGNADGLSSPFTEGYGYLHHCIPPHIVPLKTKKMSIIISDRQGTHLQAYRHKIVEYVLEHGLPIDIYGSGSNYYLEKYPNDRRIKGPFLSTEPYEDYEFHICIENCRNPHYVSEKVVNPLLFGATPIYLGCYHIDDYFPNMIIPIHGTIEEDMTTVKHILCNTDTCKLPIDFEYVKNRVNLLKHLDELFT